MSLSRWVCRCIGVLPRLANHNRAIEVRSNPKSRYSEMVRNLRSVLTRARIFPVPKVILVTSAIPGEGKTTLSMNLAASFVQQGKTVLLLEADMRRPAIRTSMGLPGRSGLSLLLAGESQENVIFAHPQMPGLFLLPEGTVPLFPSELLESDRMRDLLKDLREEFDVIVIDAPPVSAGRRCSRLVRNGRRDDSDGAVRGNHKDRIKARPRIINRLLQETRWSGVEREWRRDRAPTMTITATATLTAGTRRETMRMLKGLLLARLPDYDLVGAEGKHAHRSGR